jgi:hypothetical protein
MSFCAQLLREFSCAAQCLGHLLTDRGADLDVVLGLVAARVSPAKGAGGGIGLCAATWHTRKDIEQPPSKEPDMSMVMEVLTAGIDLSGRTTGTTVVVGEFEHRGTMRPPIMFRRAAAPPGNAYADNCPSIFCL